MNSIMYEKRLIDKLKCYFKLEYDLFCDIELKSYDGNSISFNLNFKSSSNDNHYTIFIDEVWFDNYKFYIYATFGEKSDTEKLHWGFQALISHIRQRKFKDILYSKVAMINKEVLYELKALITTFQDNN